MLPVPIDSMKQATRNFIRPDQTLNLVLILNDQTRINHSRVMSESFYPTGNCSIIWIGAFHFSDLEPSLLQTLSPLTQWWSSAQNTVRIGPSNHMKLSDRTASRLHGTHEHCSQDKCT